MTHRSPFTLPRRLSQAARALLALPLIGLMALPLPALAQDGGLFAPAMTINGQVITNYDVEQRVAFMRALRVPGDLEAEAIKGLTQDRLAVQAAKDMGLKLTPEQIADAKTEFAGRAKLTVDQFMSALADEGVDPETFQAFIVAGLTWREVVRAKFAPTATVSESQVDRAMLENGRQPNVRLLISELIIPIKPDEPIADLLALARDIQAKVNEGGSFGAAAREYSASPSSKNGGRLDWMELSKLPPPIAAQILTLAPGEVSDPVVLPQAIALFQLNNIDQSESRMLVAVEVEYAQLLLPAGLTPADIRAKADGCGDLYPLVRKLKLPADYLRVNTAMMSAVPQDVGLDLAKLDGGESLVRNNGGRVELLMLCRRTGITEDQAAAATAPAEGEAGADGAPAAGGEAAAAPADPANPDAPTRSPAELARDSMRMSLVNKQIQAKADAYLEELRSEAIIVTP